MLYFKTSLLTICATIFSLSIYSPDASLERLENSPRHHEWVDIKYDNRVVRTFVVYPEVPDNVTAVIVIHENRGLNDWARSFADQLAEAGYIAVAPDLLSGMGPNGGGTSDFANSDDARTAIYELAPEQVTADLTATVEYAKKIKASNGKAVAVGFCWGGSQSFNLATSSRDIEAAFVCYGTAPEDDEQLSRISVPVYGFYGGNDNRVNATLPATQETMNTLDKVFDPVIYPGAGHGFFRTGEAADASDDNRNARKLGLERMFNLLHAIR